MNPSTRRPVFRVALLFVAVVLSTSAAMLSAALPTMTVDSAEADNLVSATPTRVNVSLAKLAEGQGNGTYDVRVYVVGWDGAEVARTTFSNAFVSETVQWSNYVMVPVVKYGSYDVVGELLTPGTSTVVKTATSRLVKPVPVPTLTHAQRRNSYIGMNTHYNTRWAAFNKCGIHWARDYCFQWLLDGAYAPGCSNGVNLMTEWNNAKANNVTILPCLQQIFWNAADTNYMTNMAYVTTAFDRYVRAFPEIEYWELDNESNYAFVTSAGTSISAYHAAYRNVIDAAQAGIAISGSQAKLCLNGDAGIRIETYNEMLRTSGVSPVVADDFDVIGYHFYAGTNSPEMVNRLSPGADTSLCNGWTGTYQTIFSLVQSANSIAHAAGKEAWFGEFGYAEYDGRCAVGLRTQTQYVPRWYLLGRAAGCDKMFWFWDRDGNGTSWIDHMGLIDLSGNARPMGAALAALSKFTALSMFTESGNSNGIWHVAFAQPNGDTMMVVWTESGSVPYGTGAAIAAYDIFGNQLPAGNVTISPDVTYILYQGSNTIPEVSGGDDATTSTGSADLDGTASDDGNPSPPGQLTAAWSKVSGPGTVTFGNPAALDTTASFSLGGEYVLRLTVSDSQMEAFDEVTVTYDAVPHIEYDRTDLGGGLSGWTFRIANDDGLLMSYTVALGFQGTDGGVIQQIKSGAVHVSKEGWKEWDPEYQEWNGEGAVFCDEVDPAYDMARDTWAFNPFGDNAAPGINPLTGGSLNGIYNAANAFAMSCSTGTGSTLGDGVNVAYVVATGNVTWDGEITRNNRTTDVAGVTEIPATAILGDFNSDDTVTHGDYTVWADNYGRSIAAVQVEHPDWFPDGSYLPGTTTVTQGLYTTWADHFGDTRPLTVGQTNLPAVVEPAPQTDAAVTSAAAKRAARQEIRKQRRAARAAARAQRIRK